MKTKYFLFAITIFLLFILNACKKDSTVISGKKDLQANTNDVSTKILKFSNYEEYNKELDYIRSATFEERREWEESKGFLSLGRASDEFYLSLDPEKLNLKSVNELVSQNPEYLQLIKEEDGEYTLESAFWDDSRRRFVNKDKIYQIGETVYKLFSFGTINSNVKKIEKLKTITESNFLSFKNDKDLSVNLKYGLSEKTLKDGAFDCGKEKVERVTNGKDRIYIRISNFNTSIPDYNFPPGNTVNTTEYNVRPYKKTLGIWYWCKRRISCNIKIATDVFVFQFNSTTVGEYIRQPFQYSANDVDTDNLQDKWDIPIANTTNAPDYSHFGGYNCWASTPSAGPVVIQCNTQIVN